MLTNEETQSAPPQPQAANDGLAAVLKGEALRNLAGFFDVLIQMDFEQQANKERSKDEGKTNQDITPRDTPDR